MENIDPQVEAERLRHVRALIEEMLREADVCASVVLAGRAGRTEQFMFMNATWSVVHLEQIPTGVNVHIKSALADYSGDVDKQRQDIEWSAGAVSSLATSTARLSLVLLDVAEKVDLITGADHGDMERDDPRDGPQ
jgi:hypothetical protein